MKTKQQFNRAATLALNVLVAIVLCFSSRIVFGQPADAQDPTKEVKDATVDSRAIEEINMIKGDLEAIKAYTLARVSVSNPEIADIANADNDQVLIMAKKPGQTVLFIWDEYGKRTILIRVFAEDLAMVEARLRQLLDKAGLKDVALEVNSLEGKVIVSGKVPSDKKKDLDNLLEPFSASIMNLAKPEAIDDLVQIDVQIAELNTSLTKSIGFEWNSAVDYEEDPANFIANTSRDIFKVGPLSRTTQIISTVNALITQGKGRILSKPKLVVVSGKEASFLVGGEIPIRTTTTSAGGNVQQNVEFKDYGVSLTITPTIRNGKVDVILSIEVSDIDSSQPVADDIAFLTRNAKTQVYLENGQTVVMAGLIKHQEGETVRKVPFLGDIPIVGFAFRKRSTQGPNTETELVISLTPTIISQRDKLAKAEPAVEVIPETASTETMEVPQDGGTASEAARDAAVEPVSLNEAETPTEAAATEAAPEAEAAPAEAAAADTTAAEPAQDTIAGAMVPADMAPYVQSIQKKISQAIAYPFEAKEEGWEGTVKLSLHVLRDGTLKEASLKESSGHDVFDKDALNTAQILAPYDAFPAEMTMEDLIVTIPIVYSQEAALKDGVCSPVKSDGIAKPFIPAGVTYSQLVQQRIADAVIYPEEARENGWEGTVKLALHILRDGTLAYATVKESSGHDLFDDCALQTAKNLAPYSVFPAESDLQELNLTVPIVYSLRK